MKKLILICSLVFSSALFAASAPSVEIELSNDKEVDHLYTNFGMVRVGSFSYANYFVKNTGTEPLYFRSARISGIGYSARHNCGELLPMGGRCSFSVQYTPFFEGWHPGQLIMSFDPEYSVIVNLQGQAVR